MVDVTNVYGLGKVIHSQEEVFLNKSYADCQTARVVYIATCTVFVDHSILSKKKGAFWRRLQDHLNCIDVGLLYKLL